MSHRPFVVHVSTEEDVDIVEKVIYSPIVCGDIWAGAIFSRKNFFEKGSVAIIVNVDCVNFHNIIVREAGYTSFSGIAISLDHFTLNKKSTLLYTRHIDFNDNDKEVFFKEIKSYLNI
jgi:hypothetical protein